MSINFTKLDHFIYTVSLKSNIETDMDVMTSSFSTREKAERFAEKLRDKLKSLNLDGFQVSIDSGYLDDDTTYIDWIEEMYEEVNEEE